ncbi:hypothetical protein E2C01_073668 [Portunus trituberculatus]|uniref:Uncharacterized protein n=1 Tax=Portunus trituberculatus TaxID=210409 RepID=A0A5B7IAC1_PORTR|nr:hypothetical protein [Portunus trituberculatus]
MKRKDPLDDDSDNEPSPFHCRNKYMQLQSEMSSIQCRTRDMMVCQGAEVSGAAVSLNNVSSRLRALIAKLVQDYTITDADLEVRLFGFWVY